MDTPTMPIIVTRYHGPTNYRGARYSATSASGTRVYVSIDHSLDSSANHGAAATALVGKLWPDATIVGHGELPGRSGAVAHAVRLY